MSKKLTRDEQEQDEVKEAILEFVKKEATKWKLFSHLHELTYEQVVTMFAVIIGELLYKENDDEFNKKLLAYLRKKIKQSFEAQKDYRNGVQA